VRRDEGARFLAAWTLISLVPLSLSRGKLDYYLLPLYPAVSLVVGRFFAAVPWSGLDRWWARAVLLTSGGGLLVLLHARASFPTEWLPPSGPQHLLVVTVGTGILACLLATLRPTPGHVLGALAGTVAAVSFVLVFFFLPAFWKGQPNRVIAADVRREQLWRPDATVALCRDPSRAERDILFHARVAVVQRCDLWSLATSRSPFLLLIRPEERRSFRAVPGFRVVGRYRFLPARALTLGGLREAPAPGEIVLAANYPTADPEAQRKERRLYKKMLYLERFLPGAPAWEAAEEAEADRPREE
jgi:hypothetical protein